SCGCGTRFHDCAFWTEIGERAFGGWDRVDVDAVIALRSRVERTRHIPVLAVPRLGRSRVSEIRTYADYYARIYRAAAAITGADVIVDSSKHSALAYCLRWSGLDLRVVHVVRDSRGVAYSWTKRISRPEAEMRSGRPESAPEPDLSPRHDDEMTRYSPGRSAVLWTAHNAAFGVLGHCGVPVARIQYEHLIASPRATVARIAAFAGIEVGRDDLNFLTDHAVTLEQCHSAAGNPMRFLTGEIPLRRDDAWLAALPPNQRRLVGAITAPMLGAYGYRISGRKI
ncbi:MAG TPA: sulfotransferase, partial [Micromonosporaceae bacterium]